jgi:hypothetical protein
MCKYQDFWLNVLTTLVTATINFLTRPRTPVEVVVVRDGGRAETEVEIETQDGDPDETEVEIDP